MIPPCFACAACYQGSQKELGLTQHFLRRKICEASGEHPPSLDGAGFVHCDSWAARNHFGGADLGAGLPCHEPLADTPRQLSRPAQNCRRQWARLKADRLRLSPSWEFSEFSSRVWRQTIVWHRLHAVKRRKTALERYQELSSMFRGREFQARC